MVLLLVLKSQKENLNNGHSVKGVLHVEHKHFNLHFISRAQVRATAISVMSISCAQVNLNEQKKVKIVRHDIPNFNK